MLVMNFMLSNKHRSVDLDHFKHCLCDCLAPYSVQGSSCDPISDLYFLHRQWLLAVYANLYSECIFCRNYCFNFQIDWRLNWCCLFANYMFAIGTISDQLEYQWKLLYFKVESNPPNKYFGNFIVMIKKCICIIQTFYQTGSIHLYKILGLKEKKCHLCVSTRYLAYSLYLVFLQPQSFCLLAHKRCWILGPLQFYVLSGYTPYKSFENLAFNNL
jgi:hypothetical protein